MENNDKLKYSIQSKIAISIFKEEGMAMNKVGKYLKVGLVASVCLILITGGVFAKDIEKYFKNLFNNSSEAIDTAVENGYVQSEEMNFVYDNKIGVKVDNLILDDLYLDVSFKYEVKNENIKLIRCKDFDIISDSGKKVYESEITYPNSLEDVALSQYVEQNNEPQKVTENTFIDSILISLREDENSINELEFKIRSIHIVYQDDSMEDIEGNWNFKIKINDTMKNNNKITYHLAESNKYVESCTGTLSTLGLDVEFNFSTPLDLFQFAVDNPTRGYFFRIKKDSKLEYASGVYAQNTEYTKYLIRYDCIGVFDNPEKIELYIEAFDTTVVLVRD